jgi:hypothetical protein
MRSVASLQREKVQEVWEIEEVKETEEKTLVDACCGAVIANRRGAIVCFRV